MSELLLAPLFGALIGFALGMLGGGGSILTVPVLVYVLQQEPHSAVASSLIIVGANAIAGAWMHHRNGRVRMRQAFMFGGYGIAAAYLGARISAHLDGSVLLVLFALLMLVVATMMLRKREAPIAEAAPEALSWWRVMLGGAGVGFLTGFLGVGGGFLIVPALVLLLGMSMQEAVGSSLVVIAINSIAGLLGHLQGTSLPWTLIGVFVLAGMVGLLLGSRAARTLPARQLRHSFAIFVVVLAVILLAINVPGLMAA